MTFGKDSRIPKENLEESVTFFGAHPGQMYVDKKFTDTGCDGAVGCKAAKLKSGLLGLCYHQKNNCIDYYVDYKVVKKCLKLPAKFQGKAPRASVTVFNRTEVRLRKVWFSK